MLLVFFVRLDLCFSETTCGNISKSCWCIILCVLSLSTDVPKHLALSIIFILEKKATPKIDVLYSVFLSFCRSKAALFAFSGQCPAVKAPYQLLSMFSHFHFPPDRLNFCVQWLQCACMQPITGVNRSLIFQMNWPHVTNTNNWTGWRNKILQMDQQ